MLGCAGACATSPGGGSGTALCQACCGAGECRRLTSAERASRNAVSVAAKQLLFSCGRCREVLAAQKGILTGAAKAGRTAATHPSSPPFDWLRSLANDLERRISDTWLTSALTPFLPLLLPSWPLAAPAAILITPSGGISEGSSLLPDMLAAL